MTTVTSLAASALRAQDESVGKQIFLAKCAKCHGENGVPRRIAKDAPNFTDPRWEGTLEEIEHSVREGKGKDMRPFKSKLDPHQIKSVAKFVESLKKDSGPQRK